VWQRQVGICHLILRFFSFFCCCFFAFLGIWSGVTIGTAATRAAYSKYLYDFIHQIEELLESLGYVIDKGVATVTIYGENPYKDDIREEVVKKLGEEVDDYQSKYDY